jgi:hypothetical protein
MRPLRHRPDNDDNGDVENTTTTNTKRKINNNDESNNQGPSSSSLSSSWKQEDPISQGIVSALTAVVNALSSVNANTINKNHETATATSPPLLLSPPGNAEELLRRIECD